jgi:hypothetical protein
MFGAWLASRVTFPKRYNASDTGTHAGALALFLGPKLHIFGAMFRTAKRRQQQQPQLSAAVACVRSFGLPA